MPLNLYRRHRQECEGGHPEESRSGEFEERKKGWKRCACFIFASGTLGGSFKRKYTGKTDWDEAKAITAAWKRPVPGRMHRHRRRPRQQSKKPNRRASRLPTPP